MDNNLYSPLELSKLCANVIIKEKKLYNKDYYIFLENLKYLKLYEQLNDIIIERYHTINHILNVKKDKN